MIGGEQYVAHLSIKARTKCTFTRIIQHCNIRSLDVMQSHTAVTTFAIVINLKDMDASNKRKRRITRSTAYRSARKPFVYIRETG